MLKRPWPLLGDLDAVPEEHKDLGAAVPVASPFSGYNPQHGRVLDPHVRKVLPKTEVEGLGSQQHTAQAVLLSSPAANPGGPKPVMYVLYVSR